MSVKSKEINPRVPKNKVWLNHLHTKLKRLRTKVNIGSKIYQRLSAAFEIHSNFAVWNLELCLSRYDHCTTTKFKKKMWKTILFYYFNYDFLLDLKIN